MFYSLIFPILSSIILLIYFREKIAKWELIIPSLFVTIFILFFKLIYELSSNYSTEYRGNLITSATYYEYYSTWVDKTCSREVCSGSGENRTCVTEYYDCSYCDENEPYWVVTDNEGNNHTISKKYYEKLIKKWSADPQFIDMNREIVKEYSGFFSKTLECGCDGDKYKIKWDKKPETSEANVYEHSYKNKVLNNNSAFSYGKISKEEAEKMKLYEYPEYYDFYKQNAILGLEKVKGLKNSNEIQNKFEFINGLGYKTKNKTFVLLFPDRNLDVAFLQEQYWLGGNRNELVICIGYDSKTNKINWVKPFSWTDNKRVLVEIREEISELKYLDFDKIYVKVYNIIHKYFKPKNFDDFEYLDTEYSTGSYVFVYISSLIISILISIWIVKNEFREN